MVGDGNTGTSAALFILIFPVATVATGSAGVGLAVSVALSVAALFATADRSGDAWDGVPSWQYAGRYVELGGLTRSEQEEAIDEVHQGPKDE